jgi:two-component system sensor histidine kinase KdpD
LKAKDEFQAALLNSVSHDFRTPLVTITGTLSSLDDEIHQLDKGTQQKLVRDALGEAEKLNRLVSNLLNMSRLESGAISLQLGTVDVQDLIGATLKQMKNRFDCPISIHIPDEPPMISADFVLIEQALMNILDNAVKYSPEDSSIDILVCQENEWVYIDVVDRGFGIPESELPFIFNKFYRVADETRPGGTGLGLAIAKGIMDAHGAELCAILRKGGGMIFRMGFPDVALSGQDVD